MSSPTASSPPTFQLFTSIRYDPLLLTSPENSRPDLNFITPSPFYMLSYHRDRMVEAAQHFDFDAVTAALADGPALHQSLLEKVRTWQADEKKEDGPLKLRILFDSAGHMTVDFLPIPAVPLTTLYPPSFDPPSTEAATHPAKQKQTPPFTPSSGTGGALTLGPGVSLPAGNQDPKFQAPASQQSSFTPSPGTGGALTLGPGVYLPAGNQDPNFHPAVPLSPPPAASAASSSSPPPPPSSPPDWTLALDTHPTPSSPFTLLKTTHRDMYDSSRARALPSNPSSPVHREVILWNDVEEVTEGTLTSLYFFRGGRWVTPPVGVPCAFKMAQSPVSSSSTNVPTTSDPTSSSSPRYGDGHAAEADNTDEGELRRPFPGRWGHSVRSAKATLGAGGQRGTSRRWALGKGFCMEEPVGRETVGEGEGVWVSNGVRGFGFGRVVG